MVFRDKEEDFPDPKSLSPGAKEKEEDDAEIEEEPQEAEEEQEQVTKLLESCSITIPGQFQMQIQSSHFKVNMLLSWLDLYLKRYVADGDTKARTSYTG